MLGRVRVFRGVAVRRIITTTRRAALLADAEVNPIRTHLRALFAFSTCGMLHGFDRAEVFTGRHCAHPVLLFMQHLMDEGDCNRSLAERCVGHAGSHRRSLFNAHAIGVTVNEVSMTLSTLLNLQRIRIDR